MAKIPKGSITEGELRRMLRKKVKLEANSKSEWAQDNGMVPQTVTAFISGTQTAGIQIPRVFGYKPAIIYIPEDADPINKTRN